ncbi:MAG TPA: MBL fold metallo-hydrolase [Thermoanaerobaculaceae bacterium]|nr:MBL fold metallo-hydrolase [Thermoanaerobaculaceae bacterium]
MPSFVVPISLPTPYPIGPVTLYLVDGEPLTLVDTGPATAAAWAGLQQALAARSLHLEDIRRVLITHGHHDHFGLARRLSRLGAELLAHPHDRRNLALDRNYPMLWRQLGRAGLPVAKRLPLIAGLRLLDRTARPVARVTWLADRQELAHERGRIRVHHLPGHTPGHVGFELGGEGVLITGDTILDGLTPNAVVDTDPENPGRPFHSLAAYAETLTRLKAMRPRLLLPAHGPCITDVSGQVSALRNKQASRAAEVRTALSAGPATVARLIARLFPGVTLLGSFLAFSEVLGHLLELERQGVVQRVSARRVERWALAG